MKNAIKIKSLEMLKNFQEISITGGEPMLNPIKTLAIIKKLKNINQNGKLYLYTAQFDRQLSLILPFVDGIQYSIHENAIQKDINDFYKFQKLIKHYKKSFRLFIDNKIKFKVLIKPHLWKRIEVKPWLTEEELLKTKPGGLPQSEKLFIYLEEEQ